MGLFDAFGSALKAIGGLGAGSLNKSLSISQPIQPQMDLMKGKSSSNKPAYNTKSMLIDPNEITSALGYKDRPFSLSYEMLRRMATKDAVIAAIINTRVNQVSNFTRPARFDHNGIGYEIKLRDPEATPSEADKQKMIELEMFLENTGFDYNRERDSFDTFIRKIVRDRLVFDQVCFEIVPRRDGTPYEFIAVDASTIRIATESIREDFTEEEAKKLAENEEIKYVQVIDGTIQAYYTADQLAFGVANPRTDIYVAPYGFSELEMLIDIITAHLWAEQYNSKFFSQGIAKGILNIKPASESDLDDDVGAFDLPNQQIEAFKRQWWTQVAGVGNHYKTPIVSVPDIQYVEIGKSNQEMEYKEWINYLINVACAVYQIDPSEINFPNRGGIASHGGGLGEGGIEERIKSSRDKGLRPLLRFIEDMINRHIISRFDDRFVFRFVGIDSQTETERLELNQKKVQTYMTVNELRALDDLEPIEGGDILLNPVFVQARGQDLQQKMREDKQDNEQDRDNKAEEENQGIFERDDKQDKNQEIIEKDDQKNKNDKEENEDYSEEENKVNKSITKYLTIKWEE